MVTYADPHGKGRVGELLFLEGAPGFVDGWIGEEGGPYCSTRVYMEAWKEAGQNREVGEMKIGKETEQKKIGCFEGFSRVGTGSPHCVRW